MADVPSPSLPLKRPASPADPPRRPSKPPRKHDPTRHKSTPTPHPSTRPTLVRYRLNPPLPSDFLPHRPPTLVPASSPSSSSTPNDTNTPDDTYYTVTDHPLNRRGFRYTPCVATSQLPTLQYRQTEYEPYGARIGWEDMNAAVQTSAEGRSAKNEKGWRMARANVGVREGDWYYEVKILSGIAATDGGEAGGHVRVGWARREAPLDAPVGFDAYSYGIRDVRCEKVHLSRPREFAPEEELKVGDVIGFWIHLPSLKEQRELSGDPTVKTGDVIRDRLPIRFKNQLWFENFEYQPTRELEELMNPVRGEPPELPVDKPGSSALRTLPGSFIKVYRNGRYIGTPWEGLYAFLPPASRPLATLGGRELDDGTLGYYPAVSCFGGGAVEMNFGPSWWARGEGVEEDVRGMAERYNEQIAEDVVWDLVDEVDLCFTTIPGLQTGKVETGGAGQGDIKEMVMEDE